MAYFIAATHLSRWVGNLKYILRDINRAYYSKALNLIKPSYPFE